MTTPKKTTSEHDAAHTEKKKTIPRGFRNCNPLNIKKRDAWLGLAEKQSDPVFCIFSEMKYGFRAALIILRKYINVYHLNTISAIVNRWAPDGEEAVRSYTSIVSKHMGIHPHAPLSFSNRQQITLLLEGMAKAENGKTPKREDIDDAFEII